MIFGSERSSDAMRRRIKELLNLEDMFDIPGMTELYGPGTGLDCSKHEGIHYWADYYILEILDPVTLETVPAGEIGEMVVTTLCKEAAPLIRYRTRDLTRLIDHACSCGNLLPLHDRILGRSDDMIIFRAVNIYPGQIDEVLSTIPQANCEYQVQLDRRDDGKDYMTIRLECCEGFDPARKPELAENVQAEIKNKIMVSCEVDIVENCTLPRSERKSKRFFDNRPE
jgi:phenylacetate-CoA ligase